MAKLTKSQKEKIKKFLLGIGVISTALSVISMGITLWLEYKKNNN
jgi:hypothetical protein